jgi:hypothetical protein
LKLGSRRRAIKIAYARGNTLKSCLLSSQSNCAIHQNKCLPYNKKIMLSKFEYELRKHDKNNIVAASAVSV